MSKHNNLYILIFLLIIGFLLRVSYQSPLTYCYEWDETVNIQHAEIMMGKVDNFDELDIRPPFFSVVLAASYYIWHDLQMAQLVLALMSTLSILMIYLLAKEMFDNRVALLSAILLTFHHLHIYFSHYLYTNNPGMLFSLVSIYFLKKGESNSKLSNFILSGIFLSISILTRFDNFVFVPIYFINFFLFPRSYNLKNISALLLSSIVVMLPYMTWSYFAYNNPIGPFIAARVIVDVVAPQENDKLYYITNFITISGILAAIGFCLWIYFAIVDKVITRNEIFSLILFVLPWLYLSNMKLKELRYQIVSLIGYILIASVGLNKASNLFKNKLVFIFLLIAAILVNFHPTFGYRDMLFRVDQYCNVEKLKALSMWINNNINKDATIYMNDPLIPDIGYYTKHLMKTPPYKKEDFEHFKFGKNSYYIIMNIQDNTYPFPTVEDVKHDKRFKLIKTLYTDDTIYIYEIVE